MKNAKITSLTLLVLAFSVESLFSYHWARVTADSLSHQVEQEPTTGLSIVETGAGSTMSFLNPLLSTISEDKLLAISLNANQNVSPHFVDPYTFLQFSFIAGEATEQQLYFDMSNPAISSRLVKNSLYYPTSEEGYTCPNRFFADSNSYFFIIKEGFSGTIFVSLSDYFEDDVEFQAFKIFSDGNNHWNTYDLLEIYICDDIYSTGKTPLVDLSSYAYDGEFKISDENLSYQKQDIKRATTLLNRIVKAHITQSRITMLNISKNTPVGDSDLLISIDENGYKIRDVLIFNINNILNEDLFFRVYLIDGEDEEISLRVTPSDTYVLAKTDIFAINLTCDGEYVKLPASTVNATLVLSYADFIIQPMYIKAIKFVFKNKFECEIGKIIDAQNTVTGNFKTLSHPIEFKDTEGIDINNPKNGQKIFTTTDDVVFKFNDQSIYQVEKTFNARQGNVEQIIEGDYIRFVVTPNAGFTISKVYVNNVLVNVENNSFICPYTSNLVIVVTFKEAKIYVAIDDAARAVILHEKCGNEIMFKVVLAYGFTVKNAKFNGSLVTLNDDYTYYVSDNLDRYDFEISTREIIVSIDYRDSLENRHGSASYTMINSKIYIFFEPDEDYRLEKFWINEEEIAFQGKIYSINADKDLFIVVKFLRG